MADRGNGKARSDLLGTGFGCRWSLLTTSARRIVDLDNLPPTWQARHHVDRALAHIDLASDERATRAMLKAEHAAPEWMRYHATSRRVVADLVSRERRRSTPILALADRLRVGVHRG